MIIVSMETQDVIACMHARCSNRIKTKVVENVCCAQCVRCVCVTTERVMPVFSVVRIWDHPEFDRS